MIYELLSSLESSEHELRPVPDALLPYIDCSVRKIDLGIEFDVERYKEIANHFYQKFNGFKKGTVGKNNYLGLGLQYCDESNPIFDCVPTIGTERSLKGIRPTSFSKLNEIGLAFEPLISDFAARGIHLVRGRLLKSLPGQAAKQHYDLDYRIHIPIETNENAKAIFGSEKIHMSTGECYLHNGFRLHSFENLGSEPRIHLVFIVAGMSYDNGFDVLKKEYRVAIDPVEREHPANFNLGDIPPL